MRAPWFAHMCRVWHARRRGRHGPMNKATKGAVAVAALATTVQAATKQARKVIAPHDPPGWGRGAQGTRTHVVTVNLPLEQVRERGDVLAGLRDLPGAQLEV